MDVKHAEHAKTCPRKTNGVRSPLSSFSWHSLHRAKLLLSRRVSDIWGVGYGGVPFAASDQPHTVPRANADVTRVTSTSGEGDTCYIYICIYIYIYIYIYHRGRGPIPPPPSFCHGDHHTLPPCQTCHPKPSWGTVYVVREERKPLSSSLD